MAKKEKKQEIQVTGTCTNCGKKGGREIFGVFSQCPVCLNKDIDFNNKK